MMIAWGNGGGIIELESFLEVDGIWTFLLFKAVVSIVTSDFAYAREIFTENLPTYPLFRLSFAGFRHYGFSTPLVSPSPFKCE